MEKEGGYLYGDMSVSIHQMPFDYKLGRRERESCWLPVGGGGGAAVDGGGETVMGGVGPMNKQVVSIDSVPLGSLSFAVSIGSFHFQS